MRWTLWYSFFVSYKTGFSPVKSVEVWWSCCFIAPCCKLKDKGRLFCVLYFNSTLRIHIFWSTTCWDDGYLLRSYREHWLIFISLKDRQYCRLSIKIPIALFKVILAVLSDLSSNYKKYVRKVYLSQKRSGSWHLLYLKLKVNLQPWFSDVKLMPNICIPSFFSLKKRSKEKTKLELEDEERAVDDFSELWPIPAPFAATHRTGQGGSALCRSRGTHGGQVQPSSGHSG